MEQTLSQENAVEAEVSITAYCSWCLTKSEHKLVKHNRLSRDIYRCCNCHNHTLRCRVPHCECMAKGSPLQKQAESRLARIKENWNSEFCAAHDGSIPSWDNVDMKIETPDQFRKIYEGENALNMVKLASELVAMLILSAIGKAAEELAKKMDVGDAPSASEIKSIIVSRNRKELTSALTAVIGVACKATGRHILAAAGETLGHGLGLYISNHYLKELEEFDIVRLEEGDNSKPAILFINGFLQEDADVRDWLDAVADRFPDNPKYHVNWEAKNLQSIWEDITTHEQVGTIAHNGKNILKTLLTNPWYTALNNAGKTGALLAEIIARTTAHEQYIIMGHSLGCRVAYYAARALATKKEKRIDSLYLLSGAVGVDEWEDISENANNIYNFYVPDDIVVGKIYKSLSFNMAEDTIGIRKIAYDGINIHNFDVTNIIKKTNDSAFPDKLYYHTHFKNCFDKMLDVCNLLYSIRPTKP